MGITMEQLQNLRNSYHNGAAVVRDQIYIRSPAACQQETLSSPTGLNKLSHADVPAFTDTSSTTENPSLLMINNANNISYTISSPHPQFNGSTIHQRLQNSSMHDQNLSTNNGCLSSQTPQLPPHYGFPVPCHATNGVNSSPKTIANMVLNGNISFQLAPITPDGETRAPQRSNRTVQTMNSSVDEIVLREEKQNDTTEATTRGKERDELYRDGGLSSTVHSSPLTENHKKDNGGEKGINRNKTPQKLPKRKKHIPKVVIEGKPKRTPKPVTPKKNITKENSSGKRKYVRKNGPKASAKPYMENAESNDLSSGAGIKPCRRVLNFDLEDQGLYNSSDTNLSQQLRKKTTFDLKQSLTPVQEVSISLPLNPPPCAKHENEYLQENMEAIVRKRKLETMGTCINGRVNGHPPMHPYPHSEEGDCLIISTKTSSKNHQTIPPSKSREVPQVINSNTNLHAHAPNTIRNHCYSIPPCSKMIQYDEFYRNRSNCSIHMPHIYKKKRLENGNAVLPCNPLGPTIDPENMKVVDANPSASEAGATRGTLYGHSFAGDHLASELGKIFSSTHAQGGTTRRQHAPTRMLSFGHIERELIEKSNISIRGPELSSFPAVQYNQLAQTPPKQAAKDQSRQRSVIHQGPQGSIEVLCTDMQRKIKTNKHPVKGPVHHVDTMSRINTNQACLQERNAATYDRQSFLDSRGSRSQEPIPYTVLINAIARGIQGLSISGGNTSIQAQAQTAIVPYGRDNKMVPYQDPRKKGHPSPKVDLDSETVRVWNLLMGNEASDGVKGIGKEREKRWEEEREIFRGRADSFIARMHLLQALRSCPSLHGFLFGQQATVEHRN